MSELFIKQELLKTLPQVDAIILDVDGVILDVSESYRVAIMQTTQYFATQNLQLEDTGPLMEGQDVEWFKLAGGFNSDWDLTNAAVMLVIAKMVQSGAKDTASIVAQEPSWRDFTSEIKRRGAGCPTAEVLILEQLTPRQRRDFANAYKPKFVTQIFQEMYGGEDACKSLYGFEPEHLEGDGLYKEETVMMNPNLLPSGVQIGLLTGRTRTETRLAMKVAGMKIPESNWITDDDGVKKPDGRTLLMLQEKMNFKFAIYIGDTMDDLNTVKNYRELKGSGRSKIVSCIVMSGPSGDTHRRLFLEAGTEIASPDVNSFLQYLKAVLN